MNGRNLAVPTGNGPFLKQGDGKLSTLLTAPYSILSSPLFAVYGVNQPANYNVGAAGTPLSRRRPAPRGYRRRYRSPPRQPAQDAAPERSGEGYEQARSVAHHCSLRFLCAGIPAGRSKYFRGQRHLVWAGPARRDGYRPCKAFARLNGQNRY